jgi:pimeloyl-ACP methyl ester carboxylesterase
MGVTRVDRDGGSWVGYESTGPASGTPVLLVMGLGALRGAWRLQIDALSQTHRVAWADNCGMGDSGPATGRITVLSMARDQIAVVDDLGWDRFHVVGISMGGMIAQELALAVPDRVLSLTLIVSHAGGGLIPTLPTARGLFLWAGRFVANLTGNQDKMERCLVQLLYPPAYVQNRQQELQAGLASVFGGTGTSDMLRKQLAAVRAHDTRARLKDLGRAPTLIVKAGSDVLVRPKHSDRLAADIPGAQLFDLADSGHGVLSQCADRINGRLLTHFADAEAR